MEGKGDSSIHLAFYFFQRGWDHHWGVDWNLCRQDDGGVGGGLHDGQVGGLQAAVDNVDGQVRVQAGGDWRDDGAGHGGGQLQVLPEDLQQVGHNIWMKTMNFQTQRSCKGFVSAHIQGYFEVKFVVDRMLIAFVQELSAGRR